MSTKNQSGPQPDPPEAKNALELLDTRTEAVLGAGLRKIVVVSTGPDGVVQVNWSEMTPAEVIGTCQIAVQLVTIMQLKGTVR